MDENLIIKRLVVGSLSANCYVVGDADTREGMVIDPGGNADVILKTITDLVFDIQTIVLIGTSYVEDSYLQMSNPTTNYGSVGYFFENYGKTIVPTAAKLVAGEEVPEFVYVDIAVITKDNVDEIYPASE